MKSKMYKERIIWIFNRLIAMSPMEVIYRIYTKSREILWKKKYKSFRLITEKNLFKFHNKQLNFHEENFYKKCDDSFREELLQNYSLFCSELLSYGDSIAEKYFSIFDIYKVDFRKQMNWHTAFNKEFSWAFIFSSDINYRQSENLGDIRFNFELNRHHFFITLAVCFFITKDIKYLISLKEYFYNFIEKNPFMYGVCWISPMEAAVRSFSWMLCISLLKSSDEVKKIYPKLIEDMETGVKNQIYYVYNNFSLYSSANNHLIVEASMVGIAGILFNNKNWLNSGIKIISREIDKQVTEDGVDKEQSVHYEAFVMEAVSLFILLLRKNDIIYPSFIDSSLERMNDFICDITNLFYNPPDIGDNDEGAIFKISDKNESFNYYKYVLQLGELITGKNYTANEKFYEDTLFIGALKVNNVYNYKKSMGLKTYKQGGYSIFRYENGIKERLLIFDHGFLGYKALCAHGHADALSIVLSVNGEFVFIDPGTYIYNIERNFRDYFRKTISHNTIEVNGKDQSEIKGPFLWGKKAKVMLNITVIKKDYKFVSAKHYGYSPIIHSREVEFYEPDTFIINDCIKGKCNNAVQSFILSKDAVIKEASENKIIINTKTSEIVMCFKGAGNITIDEGYVSSHFGKIERTTAIRRTILNFKEESLQTIIYVK